MRISASFFSVAFYLECIFLIEDRVRKRHFKRIFIPHIGDIVVKWLYKLVDFSLISPKEVFYGIIGEISLIEPASYDVDGLRLVSLNGIRGESSVSTVHTKTLHMVNLFPFRGFKLRIPTNKRIVAGIIGIAAGDWSPDSVILTTCHSFSSALIILQGPSDLQTK